MIALVVACLCAPPGLMTFIDVRTNEVRKYSAPSSSLIKSANLSRTNKELKFNVTLNGSTHPTSQDPQILEVHLFRDRDTLGVCVLVLQGVVDVPVVGKSKAEECWFLSREGKKIRLQSSIRKDGITINFPKNLEVKDWCAVTRWRPKKLPATFSPGSIWFTVASVDFGNSALMQGVPTLQSFLKREFGKDIKTIK